MLFTLFDWDYEIFFPASAASRIDPARTLELLDLAIAAFSEVESGL
jgi:hypothetical protein